MTEYEIWGSECPYCGGTDYKEIDGWEWRSLAFHTQIMCKCCYATIHTYGITNKRAIHKAYKILYERGKNSDRQR